ncbi:MOSC domain-containing protein [Roseovarius spongiae]|uniref:MOSC domain-containing protein n=1 Tax=Roseovarius spongiae TaxID=2320272 RepID=A0A3A8AS24_9RHOB|nr:MOSC N-terminal beta barrel domain-containing protein [Roseovarius spongiae]RKF12861.1 MOSC domain-containing protein [Roseovarius spongiae]
MANVAALWRHPIKSHGREALQSVELTAGGTLPWDRRWAVSHEATRAEPGEWGPSANWTIAAKVLPLMAITATSDEAAGTVTLRHPERPDLTFDPDTEVDAFLEWEKPLLPENRAQSTGIVRARERAMTDTEFPSVSILNLASSTDLGMHMGQALSPHRWRCNIHLEGLAPWEENGWIGKTLRIGEAEFEVREPIERCRATTADPETGRADGDTLKALNANFGNQNCGVYTFVTKGGRVSVGDEIELP